MLKITLTWIAAASSPIALIYSASTQSNSIQWIYVIIILLLFACACFIDIRDHLKNGSKRFKSAQEINSYMYQWIAKGGRIVIFTRNHSWANESIQSLLFKKAQDNELTVCVPNHTELTQKLKEHGAEIITYSNLNYTPSSRFTIINHGNGTSAAVAIGKKNSDIHTIEEFPVGDPVFATVTDLIEVLRRNYKE